MTDTAVNLRAIQHYMYCPRRFALLEINEDWAENAFVVKANLMHEHVHDGTHDFSTKQKVVRSAVTLYNDDYDLFGIADCVEFTDDKNGVLIPELGRTCRVRIVEYKPRQPKDGGFHASDAIQVFAQKLCADFVWHCDSEGCLYYAEQKKRVPLPFDTEGETYLAQLEQYLAGMRRILETGSIPPRTKGQKCSGCSISDVCFAKSKTYSVKSAIQTLGKEDTP